MSENSLRRGPSWLALAAMAVVIGPAFIAAVIKVEDIRQSQPWKSPPEFPTVADQPLPGLTGTIAYAVPGEGSDRATGCVYVIAAETGRRRPVGCPRDGTAPSAITGIVWTPDGDLEVYGPTGYEDPTLIRVGAGRAARGSTPEAQRTRGIRRDGTWVEVGDRTEEGAELMLIGPDDERRYIATMDAPPGYQFGEPQWSPDGRWILVGDSIGRLLVLDADGNNIRELVPTGPRGRWLGEPFLTWHQGGAP